MEAINQFYIDLDLSGVTRIYDYGNNEHLTPGSDGQWDPSELRQRFPSQGPLESFEDDTKNRLMDLAFAAKGCLKTDSHYAKAKNKTSHNIVDKLCESESHKTSYNIFDRLCESELPYRLLPEVEPGGVVKGNVILDLKEDIEIEKFTVSLKGGARVQIRVQTTNGPIDDAGSEKYVDEEVVLFSDDRTSGVHEDHDDEGALLGVGTSGSKRRKRTLPCGNHQFPFEFILPKDVRASVPPLINSSHDHAHLVYRLKATLDKGKSFERGNIVVSRGIWVSRDWDIAQVSDFLTPVTAEEFINTGVRRRPGRVTCRATLERKAFVRRENIKCRLEIENGDSNPILATSARIVLDGLVKTGTWLVSRSIHTKTVKVTGEPVAGDAVSTQNLELPLEFMDIDDNLIPAGTLDDCGLIDVKYEIIIKLKRRGFHRNLELKIPIHIGTTNSSSFT